MTVEELKLRLEELMVPEHMYSLLIGGFPNEAFCLTHEDDVWEVYYSERGKKRGIKHFDTEDEACTYLLGKLKKYGVEPTDQAED